MSLRQRPSRDGSAGTRSVRITRSTAGARSSIELNNAAGWLDFGCGHYIHALESLESLRRLVAFYVREHNEVMPPREERIQAKRWRRAESVGRNRIRGRCRRNARAPGCHDTQQERPPNLNWNALLAVSGQAATRTTRPGPSSASASRIRGERAVIVSTRLSRAATTTMPRSSGERSCWYWRLWSPVMRAPNRCEARRNSSPFVMPAQPSRGTVVTT